MLQQFVRFFLHEPSEKGVLGGFGTYSLPHNQSPSKFKGHPHQARCEDPSYFSSQSFSIWMVKICSRVLFPWNADWKCQKCSGVRAQQRANSMFPEMPLRQLFLPLASESLLLVAAERDKFGQNLPSKTSASAFAAFSSLFR